MIGSKTESLRGEYVFEVPKWTYTSNSKEINIPLHETNEVINRNEENTK